MPSRSAPGWLQRLDRLLRQAITWASCTLLVLMVIFTIYTVVMRYVFKEPPFWGDTVALFCSIWLALMAYALAVRDREDIATEGFYIYLAPKVIVVFRITWQILTCLFGMYLFWFGLVAVINIPGHYWELSGLPKSVPMSILPLCGLLVTLVAAMNLAEDLLGWRSMPAAIG